MKYTKHGNGELKIIATHSWMDDYESWKPTIPHFDLDKFSIAFVDVRGYGKSKHIKGDYTTDEIANDIFNVADELGWEQFYLIGHSMCGMAAQKATLLDKNKRIIKTILITPVAASGFPADKDTLDFFNAIPQNSELTRTAFNVFTSNKLSNTWQSKRTARHIEVTDKEAQIGYINMWVNENFIDKVSELDSSFLVISGKNDHPQFQIENQKAAFENFKDVNFIEIESAGHFPMQETPVLLASIIENYIKNYTS